MAAARAAVIAGFVGTSNVEAARRLGVPSVGTMAHAYVEAFSGEREAFVAFAEDWPDRTTFLVDTVGVDDRRGRPIRGDGAPSGNRGQGHLAADGLAVEVKHDTPPGAQ